MPASTSDDRVSTVPKLPKTIKDPAVVSRSRRPALGGATTTITKTVAGPFRVAGPNDEDWGESPKFGTALRIARYGPDKS
jgi:hypothetical protein